MPQCRGGGNWMVNSRITPNISKFKMDSSSLFTENKELDRLMRNRVETITNKQLKMKAETKFRLMRSKIQGGAPSGCTRSTSARLRNQTIHGTDTHCGYRPKTAGPINTPKESLRVSETIGNKKITFQTNDTDGNSDGGSDNDSSDSLPSSYRGGHSTSRTRDFTTSAGLLPPRSIQGNNTPLNSSRPVSAFSAAFGSLKIRSFRSLKTLLNSDELSQSRYIAARETMLREKANENARIASHLHRRIRHFMSDLDNFNRVTRGEEPIMRHRKQATTSPFTFR